MYDTYMDVQITVNDRTVTCVCLKDIDLYSEKTIREDILYNLPKEYDHLILDLTNVSYIDSTGIGMLIYYYNYLNRKGKTFTLQGVQESIRNILKRNKLDKLITIL